jgi:hypothetical protein
MISNEPRWDIVSLDHDLGFEEFVDSEREDCGMEVVRWLENNAYVLGHENTWPREIIIHTSNFIAGKIMAGRLRDCKRYVSCPYEVFYERFKYDD